MTKAEFELKHRVKLVPKSELWEMRLVANIANWLPMAKRPDGSYERRGDRFMRVYWTTWKRTPWARHVHITLPVGTDPMLSTHEGMREHELYHVDQVRTFLRWCGQALLFLLFPLPVLLSGKWFIERKPHANDIRKGRMSIDRAVHNLWYDYGFIWPRKWMRAYFERALEEQ